MDSRTRHVWLVALFLASAHFLSGCGNSNDDDASRQNQSAAIDPRFATPQALLEYFNTLNTRLPPDYENLAPLFYPETEFQRKQQQSIQLAGQSAFQKLDMAMYDRFGESYIDFERFHHKPPRPCSAAILNHVEDRRAEGNYRDGRGKTCPFHMVQLNGRWWVSGYTLEYQIDPKNREAAEAFMDAFGTRETSFDYLMPVVEDIRSGRAASAAAARKAVEEARNRAHGN